MKVPPIEPLESRTLLAGVTILVHGYNGDVNGWVKNTASAIADRVGGADAAAVYVLTVGNTTAGKLSVLSFARRDGSPVRNTTTSGEVIIELDWSTVSSGQYSTGDVASVVGDFLLSRPNGGVPLTELPLHLIGHSRGASLVVALSQKLGKRGVWVDQETFLDPHPVDGVNDFLGADFGDAPMRVYDNVVFADNYWRTDGDPNNLDFDGESVAGASNHSLQSSVQLNFAGFAHMSVPTYYFGTVDLTGTTDGTEPLFDSWYDGSTDNPTRDKTGFAFSLIGGATRPAAGVSNLSIGSAARIAAGQSGTQVANVGDVFLIGGNSVAAGSTAKLYARYQDRDSKSSVAFYLDTDQDPYDGGSKWLAGTDLPKATGVKAAHLSGRISAAAGQYFLYAKITDAGGFTRYEYDQHAITVVTAASRAAVLVADGPISRQTDSLWVQLVESKAASVLK